MSDATPATPAAGRTDTTAVLLDRIRAGDEQARERLFARYLPVLKRWAHRRLPASARDLHETDDLVQVTLMRALANLATFESRGEGAFLAYLRQILVNAIRDEIRRAMRRRRPEELPEHLPHPGPSALEVALGRDMIERYERGLAALSPGDREMVILRVEMGFDYAAIAEASEEAFKALAPGRRVLHLATHGVSLAGLSITLAPRTRGVGGLRPERAAEDAESRDDLAALALAGAARHDTTSARDDGWLTSEEVLALDLSGVDWAVLSACESGVSDPRARESVQGLVRSFRLAGARTVLASLWPVDDAATREWMARVYQAHWRDGLATPDAVRAACRETIAARRARGEPTHPFYWGAFVATGAGN